jgi:scyllo-inositol 2-dehydrogenase (NADP+)
MQKFLSLRSARAFALFFILQPGWCTFILAPPGAQRLYAGDSRHRRRRFKTVRRIRTGVVGYGLAGRVFHAPYVSAVPALELVAIVQRTGDTAKAAYPSAAQMRSLEQLLASDVKLVVIGSPTPVHFAMAKQSLLAGKHVVCDKPMTTTLAQAEELEHIAREKGLLLFPFHNRRWDGDFKTLRTLIDEHAVGRIVTLDSRFDRYRPEPKPDAWREEAADGGGLLYDIGPHLIDQALTLFGKPTTMSASIRHDRNVGTSVDAFDLNLIFPTGRDRTILVRLGSTVIAADASPRFRLQGTSGSYTKYGLDPQEPTIVGGAKVPSLDSDVPWLPEAESAYGTLTFAADTLKPDALQVSVVPTIPGDYRAFYANVAASILGEAEPAVTARCAIRVARIIELAQESARTGSTVTVDATGW